MVASPPTATSHRVPAVLRGWLLVAALLNAAGWTLSALGDLNARGYAALLVVIVTVFAWRVRGAVHSKYIFAGTTTTARLRQRFKRPFPLAFLTLTVLAAIGGALYAPANFDALAYRTPRVLHWLGTGYWHWIPSYRGWLNTRACGFEWFSAPILLFARNDRPLFLLNLVSFLLLPGLVFSLLTRLGVPKRASWHWMWLFPTGCCFALQAGSLANDLFGTVLALAAVDCALRARVTGRMADAGYSVLAAALMTAAKSSNLPLLLPWLIAFAPIWRLFLPQPLRTAGLVLLATSASFCPTAVLNLTHCGDWTGLKAEDAWIRGPNPLVCATHNAGLLLEQNFAPPVFPIAGTWNRWLEKTLPEWWKVKLDEFAEGKRQAYQIGELPSEEATGLGFGLSTLLLAGLVAHRRAGRGQGYLPPPVRFWGRQLLLVAPFGSLVVFMCISGIQPASRLIAPYYGLLLPALLLAGNAATLVRSRWWHVTAWGCFLMAGGMIILTPSRPLWPALTILQKLKHSATVERAETVYAVYRDRPYLFAPILGALPERPSDIGLLTAADPETSLWRPFGSRRVHHILRTTTREDLARFGVKWLVANPEVSQGVVGQPFAVWLDKIGGCVLTNVPVRVYARKASAPFALVRLCPTPTNISPR
jgi:hypothetical protein